MCEKKHYLQGTKEQEQRSGFELWSQHRFLYATVCPEPSDVGGESWRSLHANKRLSDVSSDNEGHGPDADSRCAEKMVPKTYCYWHY